MIVRDYKKLARLAVIQDISHRDIAREVFGSDAHSYVGRILRGEVKTIKPEAAVRWAHLFGAAVDDLFLTRSSGNLGQTRRSAA